MAVRVMALDLCGDARALLALFPNALRIVTEIMERGKRTHSGDCAPCRRASISPAPGDISTCSRSAT
jgi:hypothetical protein